MSKNGKTTYRLRAQQAYTVLAALRYYRQNGQGDPANRADDIHAIATDNDDEISLDEAGIDELYDLIDAGDGLPKNSLCRHCDHFVEQNHTDAEGGPATGQAAFVHLCDETHHNPDDHHEAEPRGPARRLRKWNEARPDLFVRHPDGLVGPNSSHHKTQLPVPPAWEKGPTP